MKKIIVILFCIVIWNCSSGGGGAPVLDPSETTKSDGRSTEINKNYPGFREAVDESGSPKYHNGYFVKHPESITSQTFEYEVEEEDENGQINVVKRKTSVYVNYNGTPSYILVLKDKYNVVNAYVTWDAKEKYENRDDLKVFFCDVGDDKLKPINDQEFTIPEDEWDKGEKSLNFIVNAEDFNEDVTWGLCMKYKTNAPVLYDALQIKVYDEETYNVTYVDVEPDLGNTFDKVKGRIKETFNRAAVNVNFTSQKQYSVPGDFLESEYRKRELPEYLYVSVASNKNTTTKCYSQIGDDLKWIKDRVENDLGKNGFERRISVTLNRSSVKYWTLNTDYLPCTENLEDIPDDVNRTYKVGMLNIKKYGECKTNYPEADKVYLIYDKIDNKYIWKDAFGDVENISNYISPECHVILDLDNNKEPNWGYEKDQKKQEAEMHYYRTLIPAGSLANTKKTIPLGGNKGMVSYVPPQDEVVYVHELGHLLGLSDVDNPENNLMYYTNKGGTMLSNYPLNARIDDYQNFKKFAEQQWDCLHNGKTADGCLDKEARLLNF